MRFKNHPKGGQKLYKVMIALISLLVLGTIATTAEARSANIHERTLNVTETSDDFTISGKASGLAGDFVYEVEVSGTVSGGYRCFNPGKPNDPEPHAFSTGVTGSGTFVADRNGNVNFSVTTDVPTPSAADVCPNGNWTVQLVSYSGTVNIQICDNPCESNATLDSVSNISVSFP
jgi:hypothetical protein